MHPLPPIPNRDTQHIRLIGADKPFRTSYVDAMLIRFPRRGWTVARSGRTRPALCLDPSTIHNRAETGDPEPPRLTRPADVQ
jgi:hypothetical protein